MEKYFNKITWFFWLALVAVLPITSMPLVAKILHSSEVAPASVIFLLLLCITWLPAYVIKKGTFPVQVKVALAFLGVSLIATGASFFLNIPAYKDQKLTSSVLSGVVTMVLGILFYLLTTAMPNSSEKVKTTLKVLNWGGFAMLFWDFVVWFISTVSHTDTPSYLRAVQHLISTTTFFGFRSVGFAAEPSWLAHILNMVYLPYWLSATVCGFTAQKKKLWKFSFENFLLVFGAVILYKTISRAGLFAFLLILGYFFIRLNIWVVKKISQKWSATRWKSLIMIGVVLVMLAVYVGGAVGSFYFYSKLDKRMKDAFTSLQVLAQSGFSKYAEILQFGERVTYWQAGWATFNLHPVLGVGLGNAGYYFQQTLPDNAWQLTEVRHLQYHATNLMNIKSMWIRILAETGIAGFSVFLVLLVISLLTARELTHTKQPMKRTIGFMGICMLISFIMEGFSIDSFALPYLWFTLGLVAATWRWTKPEIEGE